MSPVSRLWLLVATAAVIIFVLNVIVNLVKKVLLARRLERLFPSPPKDWKPDVKKVDGRILKFHVRCATEFKTCFILRVQFNTVSNLILCHPDPIKVIQSSNAPKPHTYDFIKPLIGDGLIAANGNKWFRMRRLLTPAFHFEILRSYVRIFQDSTNVLLGKWSSEQSGQVELFHHVSLMTLDSLFKCALSFNSDCQTQEKRNPYIKAVCDASEEILNRLRNPLLMSDIIYRLTPGGRQFYKDCALTKSKATEVIKERRAALNDGVEQEKLSKRKYLDFLDILLAARDESGNSLSEEEITSEVMTFMFAGHDTTASAISWTLYNLARYPEHQEKCREEINEVFGDNEEFEWSDLGRLKYVQMCIKESNRLFPPVPRVARLLEKPYEINGTLVPEGTWVSTHIYALHHNPHVWEDPEKFDPLRFTTENMKQMSPYAYIPFSAGPRNCIGQSFALAEIKTAVSMILRKFELSVAPQNIVQEKDLHPHLILRTKNGVLVNITPRT